MIETHAYVSKPREVHAVQVAVSNMEEVAAWMDCKVATDDSGKRYIDADVVNNPTNTRQSQAFVGDWVLYATQGVLKPTFKVYTNAAFKRNYDQASTGSVMYGAVHRNYQTPVDEPSSADAEVVDTVIAEPEDVVPEPTVDDAEKLRQEQAAFAASQGE